MSFYVKSRPITHHLTGEPTTGFSAYDHADSILDAVTAYRRSRNVQHFILTGDSKDLAKHACSICSESMVDSEAEAAGIPHGYTANRCMYFPRDKTYSVEHYWCTMGGILDAIGTSRSLAEAAGKLSEAQSLRYSAPTPRKPRKVARKG